MGDISFTNEQIEVIQNCCEKVCSNPSRIQSTKIVNVLQLLGQNPCERIVQKALRETGLHKNDEIDFQELLTIISIVWNDQDTESELLHSFRKLDGEGTGYVDAEVFKSIMLNFGESLTLKELEDMMSMFEIKSEKGIFYEDFIKTLVESQLSDDDCQDGNFGDGERVEDEDNNETTVDNDENVEKM